MRQLLSQAVIFAMICLFARADAQFADDLHQFKDVRSITLRRETPDGPDIAVVIEDPVEIKRIIDSIVLKPTPPCACKHTDSALFHTKQGTVEVSFCNHCFDRSTGNQFVPYEMPPIVYEIFTRHLPPSSCGPLLFGFRPLGLAFIVGGLMIIITGLVMVWRKVNHQKAPTRA